jgi:secondary thiamine-phosphate synthase enzyme
MAVFRRRFTIATHQHDEVVDITREVERVLDASGVRDGVCTVFAAHATAGITINENADPNIGVDFLAALRKLVADHDGWLHDRVDDNAAAHIKSALVGPSVSIPVEDGKLTLGTWQDVFFCEFDGPRATRTVVVTIVS